MAKSSAGVIAIGSKGWFRDAWSLTKPFWISSEKYRALSLLAATILFNLGNVGVAVYSNSLNGQLYDAIQNYDQVKFFKVFFQIIYIIVISVSISLAGYYSNSLLQIKWRKWLTSFYLNKWFANKAYYKNRFSGAYADNPDQRISEDIHQFISSTAGLFLGILSSVVTVGSFAVILWNLSSGFIFHFYGHNLAIPGYMLWITLLYTFVATYTTFKIGRPLVKLSYQQQLYEADFRYNLVRVREYAESIASYQGNEVEKNIARKNFDNIFVNFMQIVKRTIKINLFNFFYASFSDMVPIIICAGRYFSKEITLGNMMQIINSFRQIQNATSYLIFSYTEIANWRAIMDRLLGFRQAVIDADQLSEIKPIADDKNYLRLENLEIKLPNGKILTSHLSQTLNQGDRLLIAGKSGAGKTTLIRVLNQLWPFATGKIYQKPGLKSLFIAQKPYLPKTNLKEAICYPQATNLPDDDQIKQILIKCNLAQLTDRLYEVCDWSTQLSLGEQQKIAFGRVLINRPDIIYLDEITSALDLESEEKLYQEIIESLPNSVVVSVGHRLSLAKFHNCSLTI